MKYPLLILLISLSFSISAQTYTADGTYCNNISEGDPSPDEWAAATNAAGDTTASSSCEISVIWADIGTEATLGDDVLVVGLTRGNQGTATYLFYVNTDCDSTTGDTSIGPAPGNISRGGAEIRIQIEVKNNGTVDVEDIGEWNGSGYAVFAPSAFAAGTGASDGCTGSNFNFVEFALPVGDIFDVCEADGCSAVEFTVIETKAGGSINSSDCQQLAVTIELDSNEPPVPDFTVDASACLGDAITLDASATNDIDFPDGDQLDWAWSSDLAGTFGTASGTAATSGSDISTTYTPSSSGLHTLELSVTDEKDCEVIVTMEVFIAEEPIPECVIDITNVVPGSTTFDFDASASTEFMTSANGFNDNLEYLWDFGDGTTSTIATGTHTVTGPGDFPISLTVSDPDAPVGCNEVTVACTIITPVELISFSGLILSPGISQLEWETGSELNNEKFIVERSFDGDIWTSTADIQGRGNSDEPTLYKHTDYFPEQLSSVFYRLKQIDFTGDFEYSDIIELHTTLDKSTLQTVHHSSDILGLYLYLKSQSQIESIQLITIDGQILENQIVNQRVNAGTSVRETDISALPRGLYIIRIHMDNEILTSKFIKK